jgi:hypothetical protein
MLYKTGSPSFVMDIMLEGNRFIPNAYGILGWHSMFRGNSHAKKGRGPLYPASLITSFSTATIGRSPLRRMKIFSTTSEAHKA